MNFLVIYKNGDLLFNRFERHVLAEDDKAYNDLNSIRIGINSSENYDWIQDLIMSADFSENRPDYNAKLFGLLKKYMDAYKEDYAFEIFEADKAKCLEYMEGLTKTNSQFIQYMNSKRIEIDKLKGIKKIRARKQLLDDLDTMSDEKESSLKDSREKMFIISLHQYLDYSKAADDARLADQFKLEKGRKSKDILAQIGNHLYEGPNLGASETFMDNNDVINIMTLYSTKKHESDAKAVKQLVR